MSQFIRFGKKPNDDNGCAWYNMLSPPPPPITVTGEQSADWVVLGGGLTGLAAARRLAVLSPKSRIAVIDAQRIGFGSSGRNSGFMIDLPHHLNSHSYTGQAEADKKLIRRNRAAISFMRDIVQTHDIDCDWREQGKIHAAATDRGVAALNGFARGLDALDEPYTNLSGPEVAATTGSDYYLSGLHTPGTVLVQPAALVRGLARSMPYNVQVFENSPAIDLSSDERSVRVRCSKGQISGSGLILANNSFAGQFGLLRGRVIPVCTYASMTRSMTLSEQTRLGGDPSWGLIPADPIGTTVRRVQGDRLLIRNTFTHSPNFSSTNEQRQAIRERHERSFRERFPELPDVGFEYTWGGVLGISRNARPYFGRLMPRVFAAVCQNGLGLAGGTIAGKLIAEHACGDDNPLLRDMLAESATPPARNPPAPITRLGVRSQICWKEWLAGNEI